MSQISVIIPVHNSEKTIEKCVDSVINQTYSDIEIILVNNGSSDHSIDLCYKYAEQDKRIRVFDTEKSSVSLARNIGKDFCKGEYFTFIDSDDWVDKTYCEKLIFKAKETRADMAFCGIQTLLDFKPIDKSEKNIELILKNKSYYYFLPQNEKQALGSSCRILYRTDAFLNNRFHEDLKIYEDLLFLLDCLSVSKKQTYINEKLYFYNNLSSAPYIKKYYDEQHLKTCETIGKLLYEKLNSFGFYQHAKAELFSIYSLALSGIINSDKNRKNNLKKFSKIQIFKDFNKRENYNTYKTLYCSSIKSKFKAFIKHYKIYPVLLLHSKIKNI